MRFEIPIRGMGMLGIVTLTLALHVISGGSSRLSFSTRMLTVRGVERRPARSTAVTVTVGVPTSNTYPTENPSASCELSFVPPARPALSTRSV